MAGELGFDTGPYVNVAAFCEKVLQERDGVLSMVRLIDTLNVQAQGPEVPSELPPTMLATTLVVVLKAGEARGAQTLQVVLERPDGVRTAGPESSLNLSSGPGGGASLVLPVQIEATSAGLYWADVLVNARLVARVPLHVNYGFTRAPAPPPQA